MKHLLTLCVLSVFMINFSYADEPVLTPELEEVASVTNACPCSKSCRCDESCSCRTTGCKGCCNQYADKTKSDMCVAAYCDCESSRCGCGCSDNGNKSGCCS